MTSASLMHDPTSPQPATTTVGRPRLKLKPKSPTTSGFVDGGWWPHSRDLPAELPALLPVLAVRMGPVETVTYHLAGWEPAARRIEVDGAVVRLAGYRSQRADTVDLISATGRVTLLVVPPEATPETAHRALAAAGHRGNADGVAALLTSPAAPDDQV